MKYGAFILYYSKHIMLSRYRYSATLLLSAKSICLGTINITSNENKLHHISRNYNKAHKEVRYSSIGIQNFNSGQFRPIQHIFGIDPTPFKHLFRIDSAIKHKTFCLKSFLPDHPASVSAYGFTRTYYDKYHRCADHLLITEEIMCHISKYTQ